MRPKLSVLILTDSFVGPGGGAERHVQLLLAGLDRKEFDLNCVEFYNKAQPAVLSMSGVNIERRQLGSLISVEGLRTFLSLRKLCKIQRVDVILTYFEKSDILGALLRLTLHGVRLISSRRDTGFRISKRLVLIYRAINKQFGNLVAPSSAVYNFLIQQGVASGRIAIIRNGVEGTPVFQSQHRTMLRREFGIDEHAFVIICVANLRPVKNHQMMIRALASLKNIGVQPSLVLLGEGPESGKLEKLATDLDVAAQVRFVGHVKDRVTDWLFASDVFALTSSTEGLSNALLEAQGCGLPAVVTAAGGNPEVVVEGKTGFIVPIGDAESFAEKIHTLMSDGSLRAAMARSARDRVGRQFSIRAMISGYRTLLLG